MANAGPPRGARLGERPGVRRVTCTCCLERRRWWRRPGSPPSRRRLSAPSWPDGTGVGTCPSSASGYPSFVPPGVGVAAQSSIAFFPGYPLLIRALSTPFGLSPVFAGCAVSLFAGVAATVGLWQLAVRLSDEGTADRSVVLFAFFPSAFVLSMVYADALFIALSVWCLLALLDRRWLAAGAAAAAAGLVRPDRRRALRRLCVGRRRRHPERRLVACAGRARARSVRCAPYLGIHLDPYGRRARLLRGGVPRVGEPPGPRSLEHPRRAPASR